MDSRGSWFQAITFVSGALAFIMAMMLLAGLAAWITGVVR